MPPTTWPPAAPPMPVAGGMLPVAAGDMEAQQLRDLLTMQIRLRQAAQQQRDIALRGLVELAEGVCVKEWDEQKRQGQQPDTWPAERIIDFIKRSVLAQLRQMDLSRDPRLLEKHEALAREAAALRGEHSRLVAQVAMHLATMTALSNQLAQATARADKAEALQKERDKLLGLRGGGPALPANVPPPPTLDAAPPAENDSPPPARPSATSSAPAKVTGLAAEAPAANEKKRSPSYIVPDGQIDDLLTIMGAEGICRQTELTERLTRLWGVGSGSGKIKDVFPAAREREYVTIMPVPVKLQGSPARNFVRLTESGRARLKEIGVEPVAADEYERGIRRHKTPEHLFLILETAQALRESGYTAVTVDADCVQLEDGREYCPDIAAKENGPNTVYIECETGDSDGKTDRSDKWQRAATAGYKWIRLVAWNRTLESKIAANIQGEMGLAQYRLLSFNINDYRNGARGRTGTIWTTSKAFGGIGWVDGDKKS